MRMNLFEPIYFGKIMLSVRQFNTVEHAVSEKPKVWNGAIAIGTVSKEEAIQLWGNRAVDF